MILRKRRGPINYFTVEGTKNQIVTRWRDLYDFYLAETVVSEG